MIAWQGNVKRREWRNIYLHKSEAIWFIRSCLQEEILNNFLPQTLDNELAEIIQTITSHNRHSNEAQTMFFGELLR